MDAYNTTPKRPNNKKFDHVKSKIDTSTPKSILLKPHGGVETPTRTTTPKQVQIVTPRTQEREHDLRTQINRLRSEVELHRSNEIKFRSTIEELKSGEQEFQTQIDTLKAEVDIYKSNESILKLTIEDLSKDLQSKEVRIEELEIQNAEMNQYLDTRLKDVSAQVSFECSLKESDSLDDPIEHENEIQKLRDAYDDKISVLESTISSKNQEVLNLRKRLKESRTAREDLLAVMTEKSQKYDKQILKLQKEVEEFYFKNREVKVEKRNLQLQLDDAENKLKAANDEKAKCLTLLEERQAELLEKDEQISQLRNQNLESNSENVDPQAQGFQLNSIKNISQLIEEQIKKCSSSESVKEELLVLRYSHKDLEKQLQTKIEELNSAKIDLRISKRERAALESKLNESNSQIQKLEDKYKKLENTKENDERVVNNMEKKIKDVEAEVETRSTELKLNESLVMNLHSKILDLETKLMEADTELRNLQTRISQIEKEKAEAERKVMKAGEGAKQLKQACQELEKQNSEIESQFLNTQELHNRLHKQILQKDEELGFYKQELRTLKETLRETLEAKQRLEEQCKMFEGQMELEEHTCRSEVMRYQEKYSLLVKDTNDLKSQIQELNYELIQSTKKVEKLTQELQHSRALLHDTQMHRTDKITENLHLEADLKKMNAEKLLLEDQVAHLEHDIKKLSQDLDKSTIEYASLEKLMKESKMLFEEQLKQKSKLIDLLQKNIVELESKHKPLFEKLLNRDKSKITSWRGTTTESTKTDDITVMLRVPLPQKESITLLKNDENPTKKVVYYQVGSQRVEINCIQQLAATTYIIGASCGMYILERNTEITQELVQIGFQSTNDILIVPQINRVLFSQNENGKISMVPLDAIKSKNQKKLKSLIKEAEVVAPSSQFVRVKFCQLLMKTYLAIVKTSEIQLLIWQNEQANYSFKLKNSIRAENITSLNMGTKALVYVANDKLYEADYLYFEKSAILDELDESLGRITTYTTSSVICPMDIFIFSEEPELEYLVCFSEFGMFVDGEGKRSRDFIEWSKRGIPISFALHSKYLYIVRNTGVEILAIESNSFKKGVNAISEWKPLSNIVYLGRDVTHMKNSIYVRSSRPDETEVLEICPKGVENSFQ